MIVCVIPAYRASKSVCRVVAEALPYVDRVIVVDDACPELSGELVREKFESDPRVVVKFHPTNRGVGGATKTGFQTALDLDASIIIKMDADGQMDPRQIPVMLAVLRDAPDIVFVKGNRLLDSATSRTMPLFRLIGNSALSLLVRACSGYWNCLDPTNGYIAIRASQLRRLTLSQLKDRFFFEISLLCALGLRKRIIAEVEIPARYGDERSNLSLRGALFTFPPLLIQAFLRRILFQYLIFDLNVGSLFLFFGTLLGTFGLALGIYEWLLSGATGIMRSPGTIMLVALPIIVGFQLVLSAITYDLQSAARTISIASPALESETALQSRAPDLSEKR